MTNLLFLCARNRLRSPTAERVFASRPGVETASAGLAPDAEEPVTPDHLAWADLIFVMERAHRAKLQRRFGPHLNGKRVICLDTPDDYAFMQPELVALLDKRVGPHLPSLSRWERA
ncbi:MAG: low molecular weight protein tyrosine phosphatase family protein [Pseudomonadota bacterium]|nr:low molecular weight protein tyrosine phosphatase family protein [Pseudomonadota bacterium]